MYWSKTIRSATLTQCTPCRRSSTIQHCSISPASSVIVIPAYRKHQHRVSPSHTIQFNIWSHFTDLTYSILHHCTVTPTVLSGPDCTCSHQANSCQMLWLLTFCSLYFISQQRSREHFNLLILLSCDFNYFISQQRSREHFNLLILLRCHFNNFVTSTKHKFKTRWRRCSCTETCSSAYGEYTILLIYIYMLCFCVNNKLKSLYYVMLYYMLYLIVLYYAIFIILCYIILYYIILYFYVILYFIMLYYAILYCIILCYIYYIILHNIMLYCIILYYIIV